MSAYDPATGDRYRIVSHIRIVFSGPRWPSASQDCAGDLRAAGYAGPIDQARYPTGSDLDASPEFPDAPPDPDGSSSDPGPDPAQLRWEWT